MSEPNLLDIVPDQLFQRCFISEVDKVQNKLQYEIERKREDLRAMVGERYRDLIHAADTIEEMKLTSSNTLDHIGGMIATCKNLHNTHLVGFKAYDNVSMGKSASKIVNPIQGISIQVKVLMEIPERIWSFIETEDFVKATELFILARHINTGLQLQIGGKNSKCNMETLQRTVQKLWYSLSNFNQIIIDACRKKLLDVDISVEVACSCLTSLYLLETQDMVELLNILIEQNGNSSIKSTLDFKLSQILEGDVKSQIKEKIVNGVKIVLKTVVLIYSCFFDKGGGAVLTKLRDLYRKDSQYLIKMVHFSDPAALNMLPSTILNYRLSTNSVIEGLSKDDITQSVGKWSIWVQAYIKEKLEELLQNITRVKVLHEIREEAFKIAIPKNWSAICEAINLPQVHVWCHYYQPLFTKRVKTIIDNRGMKIHDIFKMQLLVDLTKLSSESELEKESDINWFVWKDLIGDTTIETRNEVIKVMNSLMKGMSRQDQGFTPNLENLCKQLDEELQKLLEDLKVYLYYNKKAANKEGKLFLCHVEDDTAQMYIDKEYIENYLRDVADSKIHDMIQYIKACYEEPTLQSSELQQMTTAIYTARFLQAIPILIPHLRKCYIPINNSKDAVNPDDKSLTRWTSVNAELKKNSLFCWNKWLEIVMRKITESISILPQEFTLEANIEYLLMQWDTIKIEEKGDDGTTIESIIKVPAGPSLKLQEYLYKTSRILDDIVPYTLPTEVHLDYIENVTNLTIMHYDRVIRANEKDVNQRCALQLLMDVRHVTLLLVPRENKKFMDASQSICEFLRQKIDPFDYDVFYPYIQTNLKRSVQRVQILLGSLVLHHGQLNGIIGSKPVLSGGTGDKSAAILASSDSHWFSLLPVATPSNAKKPEKPVKKKQQVVSNPAKTKSDISELMTSSLPLNFANARSGAASFFNSVASEWFSSS